MLLEIDTPIVHTKPITIIPLCHSCACRSFAVAPPLSMQPFPYITCHSHKVLTSVGLGNVNISYNFLTVPEGFATTTH